MKKAVDAFYKANSIDASFHSENLKMALDELKEVDPEAAKAYTVKDDKDERPTRIKRTQRRQGQRRRRMIPSNSC